MPRLDRWGPAVVAAEMDAAHRAMRGGGFAVVERDGAPMLVWFLCPCGCGQEVMLPAQGAPAEYLRRRPWWRVDVAADGTVSLRPSVITLTCGAHFVVTRGGISWCGALLSQACDALYQRLYRRQG